MLYSTAFGPRSNHHEITIKIAAKGLFASGVQIRHLSLKLHFLPWGVVADVNERVPEYRLVPNMGEGEEYEL